MNTLDIILLLCFIPGVVKGISKGFIRQAAALVGIIVGVWASWHFGNKLAEFLKPSLEVSEAVIQVISFAAVFIAVTILAALLGWLLSRIFKVAMMGWLDKGLGVLFGMLVTTVILGVIIVLYNTLDSKLHIPDGGITEGSVIYNTLKDAAYAVFPYLKQMLLTQ